MTIHQPINELQTLPAQPTDLGVVQTPVIDEDRIRHLAFTKGANAAQHWAASSADRLNAGLRARLDYLRTEAQSMVDKFTGQMLGYDTQADDRSDVKWRRTSVTGAFSKMTKMELVQCAFYIVLSLAALCVATYALASVLQEKEVIEKLSGNLWQAVAYAFPVVLASSGFATMATLHDDEKVIETRTMQVLKWGAIVFVAWIVMSAIVFVGENGGFNEADILAADNDPFAAAPVFAGVPWIDNAYVILRAVFPSGVTSSLLVVVHIIAEVLIAAGLTARVVLMGRKTRDIEVFHCERSNLAREKANSIGLRKNSYVALVAAYTEQITQIDAVKAQFIDDVTLLAESEERMATAAIQVAKAKAEQDFLGKSTGAAL